MSTSESINKPGHVAGCECDECLDLELHIGKLARQADRELDAEDREQHDADYWRVWGDQHAAKVELAGARRNVERIEQTRERVRQKRSERLTTATRFARKVEAHAATEAGRRGHKALSGPEAKAESRAAAGFADLGALDRKLAREQQREEQRAAAVAVIAEPRIYAPDSDASFFRDLRARLIEPDEPAGRMAAENRAQLERELAYEVGRDSEEGRRVLRLLKEQTRSTERPDVHERVFEERVRELRHRGEQEVRALTTGGGITASASGGGAASFVSPAFLLTDWAPYRGLARVFIEQCHKEDLPPFGLQVYIPQITSTTSASQQTEGAALSESVPSTALEGAKVETVSGKILITQQISDRGFTSGGSFDKLIGHQIHQTLAEKANLYVLDQALATATGVAGEGTYSTKGLYKDLAKAREVLTDTAGTRLRPTHLFTTTDQYSWATRQVDATTERPIVTPQWAPGFPISNGADDGAQSNEPRPAWARFTGTVLPGNVLWFTDDALPVSGTGERTPLVIAAPDQALTVCEGEPILDSFVETAANELRVVVVLRSYLAAIVRHQAGFASVVGGGYVTSQV